jgi:hypothetical protein
MRLGANHNDIKMPSMTTPAGEIIHATLPRNMAFDVSLQSR